MYTAQITGAGLGLLTLAATFPVFSIYFEQPFMRVHKMEVEGREVIVDRSYPRSGRTVADWSVVVVRRDGDSPSCVTKHGLELHQGWSVYDGGTGAEEAFPLDFWANDEGCADRLEPGEYEMFVTWTPRDGSDPVTARTEFDWP